MEGLLEVLGGAVLADEFVFPAEVQSAGQVFNFGDELLFGLLHLLVIRNQ